jgi:hypothetical protein
MYRSIRTIALAKSKEKLHSKSSYSAEKNTAPTVRVNKNTEIKNTIVNDRKDSKVIVHGPECKCANCEANNFFLNSLRGGTESNNEKVY